jgi:divalent metal cation (Fe/Co/Zn/Cd) transporter
MDEAVPDDVLQTIRDTISAEAMGAIEAHDLRTRHAGRMIFIDFHLVVAGQTTVTEAHDICDRVERALRAKVADSQITIHVEPENKAKHSGVLVV